MSINLRTRLVSKSQIIDEIESAFANVKLDGGLSLKQTQVVDNYGSGVSAERFALLPNKEVTENWTAISSSVLDGADCLAHLDAKGFKYYIPALMVRIPEVYDATSMMVIGTLGMLYRKTEDKELLYMHLTAKQRQVIAKYLQTLPKLVDLEIENKTVVERALRNYWSQYLD